MEQQNRELAIKLLTFFDVEELKARYMYTVRENEPFKTEVQEGKYSWDDVYRVADSLATLGYLLTGGTQKGRRHRISDAGRKYLASLQ